MLPDLLGDPDVDLGKRDRNAFGSLKGRALAMGTTGYLADQSIPGALIRVRLRTHSQAGVRPDFWAVADDSGRFVIPGLEYGLAYTQPYDIEAYAVSGSDGTVTAAPDRGVQGAGGLPGGRFQVLMDDPIEEVQVVAVSLRALTILDAFDPRRLEVPSGVDVFDARSESPPAAFGSSLPVTRAEADLFDYETSLSSLSQPVSTIFGALGSRLKVHMKSGASGWGQGSLFLGEGGPPGQGMEVGRSGYLERGAYGAATSLVSLNGHRIHQLESHGVRHHRLRQIHGRSTALLDSADQYRSQRLHRRFLSAARHSLALALAAHREVDRSTTGVIGGALVFLFLLIPYAFFLERLLPASRSIRGRLTGFFCFFLGASLLFGSVHPAFSLSLSPLMILLGFVILSLSGGVSLLGVRRLNRELHRIGNAGGVGRRATVPAGASIELSLALMRRRPFRTGLTTFTLVLLTFSLISFASVRSSRQTLFQPAGGLSLYEGALVRLPDWEPLPISSLHMLTDRFGSQGAVGTAWLSSGGPTASIRVEGEARHSAAQIRGIVGLTPSDETVMRGAIITGRWMEEGEGDVCLLSVSTARDLGLDTTDPDGAWISLSGERFRVIGFLDADRVDRILDLDGERRTPLDGSSEQPRIGTDLVSNTRFVHLPASETLFLPFETVLRMEGASLASVSVRLVESGGSPGSSQSETDKLTGLSESLDMTLFAGVDGRRVLVTTVGLSSVAGAGNLAVPIVLAALIILNTMLGSVYERAAEIGILNAIGLSPFQVSSLFLLEATVYALVGAVFGYLIGLTVGNALAAGGLLPGVDLNYTTSEPLLALGVVIAIGVASSAYPSWLAGRICTPGVERRWKLPEPEGDILVVPLPFTLPQDSAIQFLKDMGEFLAASGETSGVTFSAEHVNWAERELTAAVRLAPFDQAITQEFRLMLTQGEDGICEIVATCRRTGGGEGSLG